MNKEMFICDFWKVVQDFNELENRSYSRVYRASKGFLSVYLGVIQLPANQVTHLDYWALS